MSKLVIIASDGKPYSVYRLYKAADKIVSDRLSVRIFDKEFGKLITEALTIQTASEFVSSVMKQDLRRKILLDPNGFVLGGELSIVKALFLNKSTVRVVKFKSWDDLIPAYFPTHKVSSSVATTQVVFQ